MKATEQLHKLGQSLWLDSISRDLLDLGDWQRYVDEFSITGLTSNPTIFDEALRDSNAYDAGIGEKVRAGQSGEALFLELALEDLRRAADSLRPVFEATEGTDGWVSMEVSPLLANDTAATIEAAASIFAQADRPNLFVKIPGTPAGVPAIEESIFDGVPINVTLLFSPEQYLACAEAYLRGIARRIAAGRDPKVASVASLFVSRWDKAVRDKVPPELHNRLGIAVSCLVYRAYRELLLSARWKEMSATGARPQRLLWASTGTKDPKAPDTLYVEALIAPDTINTIPERTLRAFADHGRVGELICADSQVAEAILLRFKEAGIDLQALAKQLQDDGAASFVKSWQKLLQQVAAKSGQPPRAPRTGADSTGRPA